MDFLAITHSLDQPDSDESLFRAIVNTPFTDKLGATKLGLGISVLLLADEENATLDRIALSDTEMASGAVAYSAKPFHEIRIPLDYTDNLLIKSFHSKQYQVTEDWAPLFVPELTPEEARFNQAGAGIACSIVYPLLPFDAKRPLGAMIFSYFEPLSSISARHHAFMRTYTDTVAAKLAATNRQSVSEA